MRAASRAGKTVARWVVCWADSLAALRADCWAVRLVACLAVLKAALMVGRLADCWVEL